jgi:hypothetical protein
MSIMSYDAHIDVVHHFEVDERCATSDKKRENDDMRSQYILQLLLFQHTTTMTYSKIGVYKIHQ